MAPLRLWGFSPSQVALKPGSPECVLNSGVFYYHYFLLCVKEAEKNYSLFRSQSGSSMFSV